MLRVCLGKTTAGIHGYHDVRAPALAAGLARRAPGYARLGLPDRRRPVLRRHGGN
jgi:hypothetical protein